MYDFMDKVIIDLWKKLLVLLCNCYFLMVVVFIVFMVFFDWYDVLMQIYLQCIVNKLEYDKVFYEEQIENEEEKCLDMQINEECFVCE